MTQQQILFYIPSNLFLIYSFFRVMSCFFDRSHVNRWLEAACLTGWYLLNTGACIALQQPILNLLTMLLPPLGFVFLYPAKLWQRLTIPVMTYSFCMLTDALVLYGLTQIGVMGAYRFSLIAPINGLLMFLLALVLQKRRVPNVRSQLEWVHWAAILLIPTGSIAVLSAAMYTQTSTTTALVATVVLLFINVLVFYLFDMLGKYYAERSQRQLLEQQNRAFAQQFDLMRQSERQMRTLRHDMKNHLSVLRQFALEGQMEELDGYLDAFSEKLTTKGEYVKTGCYELDSILNYKLGQAAEAGAVLELMVQLPEKLSADPFDLNVILGNLLDNAIEGLQKSDDKRLTFYLRLDRGVCYIKVSNSYDGIVKKENGIYLTRKKNQKLHGMGLSSIQAAVEKYHGELHTSDVDRLFTAEAVLYLE